MIKYNGELGDFEYDPKMFEIQDGALVYVGGTHYGCIKCKIPEGVKNCDNMFAGNTYLKVGPILPKSCISANYAFAGCKNLMVFPDINLALMESDEFDSATVFEGCTRLQSMCILDDNSELDVWISACEHSVDYSKHVANVSSLIDKENERRQEDYKVQHWLKYNFNKRFKSGNPNEAKRLVVSDQPHHVIFDNVPQLTNIIAERKNGIYLGLVSTSKAKPAESVEEELVEHELSDTDTVDGMTPIKMDLD